MRVIVTLYNELGSDTTFLFPKEIVRNWCNFSIKCVVEFARETTGPEVFPFGRCLSTNSTSLLDRRLFRLSSYS